MIGYFNPRSHMGSDRLYLWMEPHDNNFNPRSHMGSDASADSALSLSSISIHAPTWGATGFSLFSPNGDFISIHAPTWGATNKQLLNPMFGYISIHAPTWGATTASTISFDSATFQSTLPHGERPINGGLLDAVVYFNPRSHMGSDQALGDWTGWFIYFNPRSHMGSDSLLRPMPFPFKFQSTLPHGERRLVSL